MVSDHVLRVKRNDSDEYVLIDVISIGPALFDLQLFATEGASPFAAKLKHSRIAEFHSKKSPVGLSDWGTILRAILLQERIEGPDRAALEDVEVTVSVVEDYVTIIFRKNLSGVTQRIGKIPIKKDENQEIDTIGWVGTAVARSEILENELVGLKARSEEQNNVIQKLNQQLEDLINSKKANEDSLLEKFRELLNAKKLKIRDQQRLLATSKVDPSKATQIQSLRASSPSSSRPGKRKSNKSETPSHSDDDGFEKSNVDVGVDDLDASTPEKSDLDAASEDEGYLDAANQPAEDKAEAVVAGMDDEEETESDDDDDEL